MIPECRIKCIKHRLFIPVFGKRRPQGRAKGLLFMKINALEGEERIGLCLRARLQSLLAKEPREGDHVGTEGRMEMTDVEVHEAGMGTAAIGR